MQREVTRVPGNLGLGLPGWKAAMVLAIVLACCASSSALDPSLDISQYAHTSWRIRDGFTRGITYAMAQTPDGYLWLGTEFGLVRFDGVRAVPWQPPGDNLPAGRVLGLLAARDGTLWVGADKGLASWKDGKLTQYPDLAGVQIGKVLEGSDGTVWAGGYGIPYGRLCALRAGGVHCYGEDGSLGPGVSGLFEDRKGNLWVGAQNGLWRWKPGTAKFYSLPENLGSIRSFIEDDDGTLVFATGQGLKRLVDGKIEPYTLPGSGQQVNPYRILRDRDGGLWIGTYGKGLVHIHQGKRDVFGLPDTLSGGLVLGFFEDREGNIWVSTDGGLDRFRNFAATTISTNEGLPSAATVGVLADKDGTVWISTALGLSRWNHGEITAFGSGSSRGRKDGKLNADIPVTLFQDRRGRIWAATVHGLSYIENDRFIPVPGIPGPLPSVIAEDKEGALWVAHNQAGLFRLSPEGDIRQIPWAGLGHTDNAWALAADPVRGGLWLGFGNGGITYLSDAAAPVSYGPGDGLGEGRVSSLRLDHDGTLWAATEGGLSRFKNGRIATLTGKNGLPCDTVHWAMEDDDHSLWLYMPCGLVRVAQSEMDAWAAAMDRDKNARHTVRVTVFDNSDGVRTEVMPVGAGSRVTKSADGRLWFVGVDGVRVVDPHRIASNQLPPPVHVEEIIAGHKTYSASSGHGKVSLPALTGDLEIDYTALSLVAPEKVLFRYKLEGHDRDWQDAGTRRQAFYTNLPPRNYRFRVMAANNSGMWNETGAFLDFSIAPAWYQTAWFRIVCVAAFLGLLWGIYWLRVHQLRQQFNAGLEGRVNERTRIARELHDTLLQSFQALLLRLYAVTYSLKDRPDARQKIEDLVRDAEQAIREGREAVQGIRASTLTKNDLAYALRAMGESLAAEHSGRNPVDFSVAVEGESRDLHPILRDEVYRIGCEAIRNAFRHSGAKRIEVEIYYDTRQLRMRIRDNGKGIAPDVLNGGGRTGHYGLPGMHERAKSAGGKLTIWSAPDSGTEIEMTIPSSRAYIKNRTRDAES